MLVILEGQVNLKLALMVLLVLLDLRYLTVDLPVLPVGRHVEAHRTAAQRVQSELIIRGSHRVVLNQCVYRVQVFGPEVNWAGLKMQKCDGDETVAFAVDGLELEETWLFVAESSLEIGSHPDKVLGFLPLPLVKLVIVLALAQQNALGQV